MQHIPDQPQPAAFPAILQAYETARQLPVLKHAPMRVGVCRSADGEVAACGVLEDYRQVRLFTIQLEAMGYASFLLGAEEEMRGCDILFRPRRVNAGEALLAAAA